MKVWVCGKDLQFFWIGLFFCINAGQNFRLDERSNGSNLNFLISLCLQHESVNLWYFKLKLFDVTELIFLNIKGLRYWDIVVRKSEFVAKAQFFPTRNS